MMVVEERVSIGVTRSRCVYQVVLSLKSTALVGRVQDGGTCTQNDAGTPSTMCAIWNTSSFQHRQTATERFIRGSQADGLNRGSRRRLKRFLFGLCELFDVFSKLNDFLVATLENVTPPMTNSKFQVALRMSRQLHT